MSNSSENSLELSEEELRARLQALRNKVPLSAAEMETLREIILALQGENFEALKEVLREWNYHKMRKELRKQNWPLLTLAASVLVPFVGWFIAWVGPKLPALLK